MHHRSRSSDLDTRVELHGGRSGGRDRGAGMNLTQLHESFIEMANRPMTLGSLPVRPVQAMIPVIAIDRWKETAGVLHKTYRFRRRADRDDFVIELLAYETHTEHCAQIKVDDGVVELVLMTKDVNRVTELDREYARYADVIFRNLVYSPRHEDES